MGNERVGKVQTVRGLIEPDQMGITLMHEHLLIDFRCRFQAPEEVSRITFAQAPAAAVPRMELRYDPTGNLDNLLLLDEQEAIDEALLFKQAGGGTIVDTTTRGLGRDPHFLTDYLCQTTLNAPGGEHVRDFGLCPVDHHRRRRDPRRRCRRGRGSKI